MKLLQLIILVCTSTLLCAVALASDQLPGKPQATPVLLVGGDVYTVAGDVIPGGSVLFADGKIVAVGKDIDAPPDATRIDCAGKRVYPGLFALATDLGLVEIAAVRATLDSAETGQLNPNARAEVAVNPDSELIPVARANGVLLNLTAPSGGVLSGTSAVMQLDGWTWEQMTLRAPAAMHLAWPRMSAVRAWWEEESAAKQMKGRDDQLKAIDQAFADARAYMTARQGGGNDKASATPLDARWEAMVPVLQGKVPLIVEADDLAAIQAAVAFAAREKVKLIILGGYDAPRCADLLKRHDVPVIVESVHRLPLRRDDAYDAPFTLPQRLREAGIRFAITDGSRSSSIRNLPYHAATAAAHGLPPDEALRAITLYPAQITGVADRVGSIEKGKDATLIVTDGDILETPTKVERAWVQGRGVDLTSRHTQLYEKYREKYRRMEQK